MALPCPNCKKSIQNDVDVKWFGGENGQAAVYCCPLCYSIATRFYNRAASELKQLLDMLKESTRIGLAEGRLNFPERELSKKELLEGILQLKENKDARRAPSR